MPPTCPKRRPGTDGAPHIGAGGHRRRKDARSVGPVTIPVRVDDGPAGTDESPPGAPFVADHPQSPRSRSQARCSARRSTSRPGGVRRVGAAVVPSGPDGGCAHVFGGAVMPSRVH
ncbi:hypothetical protein GCM10010348_01710 [Streptomyces anthocyanicus]|nr:hypothetical protein GCM10010348_01710 [Streptomyces anthocyanicus]